MRRIVVAASLSLAVLWPSLAGAQDTGLIDPALIEGDEAATFDGGEGDDLGGAEPLASDPPLDAATLADLKTLLRDVAADLQSLRAELLSSGRAGFEQAGGATAIDRMNLMERRIAALTERTETLEHQLRRVVADGTNRIGDIEFRLCEVDPNCDLGALMTVQLGEQGTGALNLDLPGLGAERPASPEIMATPLPPPEDTPTRAAPPPSAPERGLFNTAREALKAGDLQKAEAILGQLVDQYAGGPLTEQAQFMRGAALAGLGRTEDAMLAWLEAFSANPDGEFAPQILMAMGRQAAQGDDPAAACDWLGEISLRFPTRPEAAEASALAGSLACDATGQEGDGQADGN